MRAGTLLALPLLAKAAVLGRRQQDESFSDRLPTLGSVLGNVLGALGTAPTLQAYKIEEVPARLGGKRLKITYGPYKLGMANYKQNLGNSMSLDPGGNGYANFVGPEFPKDVMVLEAESKIVDERFNDVGLDQNIYNHHVAFMDFSKPPKVAFACEGDWFARGPGMPASVLVGGATENGPSKYTTDSVKTGYYLGPKRNIMMVVNLINYNNETKTVYTQTEFEFLPGRPAGYLDTTISLLDPGMCQGDHGFEIRPKAGEKKFDVVSKDVVAANDGYIINARGHLHDGGVNMRLFVNDQEACVSNATYGGEGHVGKNRDGSPWETIRETTLCTDAVKIKKGDKIVMKAHYDLLLHPSREIVSGGMSGGGMGGMGGMSHGGQDSAGDGHAEAAEQMALFATYFAPIV